MDLFTYLMSKKGINSSVHGDLMAYLLGQKNTIPQEASGTSITIEAKRKKINKLILDKESTQTLVGYNIFSNPKEASSQVGQRPRSLILI